MIKKLLAFSIIFCALASVSYGAAGEPERGYISLHGSASREVSPNIAEISFSRQFYNDSVTMYNTKLELFPSNIVGNMFGFKPEALFNVESEEARKNVKVDFNK